MNIPDPIEQMENMAESWAFDNVKGNEFKCDCGKWIPLNDGQPIDGNPYSPPVCPDCFDSWMLAGISKNWSRRFARFEIDWTLLNMVFDNEIKKMEGCEQDEEWHSEGNVWNHTKMVLESLVKDKEWQEETERDSSMTFLAALLHDIGKVPKTKKSIDGHIVSIGHASKGARMTRCILSKMHMPIVEREKIVQMVLMHMIPSRFTLLSESEAKKSVIRGSMGTPCNLLSLVARADVKGRMALDKKNDESSLENIELFREFCRENNCFTEPFVFKNEYSRFMYFRKDDLWPQTDLYDPLEFEVVMMSGLPGSGKDHYIKSNLSHLPVLSLDEVRARLKGYSGADQGEVMVQSWEEAKELLRKKQPFVFNATNITRFFRRKWIDLFYKYGARTKIIYIEPSIETILKQNGNREGSVPEDVIYRLFDKMDMPNLTEAHVLEINP